MDLGAFQPVLGRIFHVESEIQVQNTLIWRPEAKKCGKRTYAQTLIVVVLIVVNKLGFLVIARNPPDGF